MASDAHPLRKYRDDNGLKQAELAERVRTTKATICKIERGTQLPGLDLLQRIRKATGLPAEALRPDWAEIMREDA